MNSSPPPSDEAPAALPPVETPPIVEPVPAQLASVAVEQVHSTPEQAPAIDRQQVIARALDSAKLPRGLRDRLQAALTTSPNFAVDETSGEPLMRVGELIGIVEQALPQSWQLARPSLARPQHPAGETFFTSDDEATSDAQAEQIAFAQLSRSGFLKK